jgi:hypothetical protein
MRLVAARHRNDEVLGTLAAQSAGNGVWATLGHRSFADRDRLGASARTVRQRVWLERRMCALPKLREALRSGRLRHTKALLVAKDATPENVEERIALAASTTWQQGGAGARACRRGGCPRARLIDL